ncbi:uncharacterized protein L969DRAFT_94933 [Mixia osmundae IAM 14324]|uniref:Uncharacterized protein n=1 Tax=Mixia osmundae (strain CBS 9802 / IAM 14324 / JCM 22182 / KY 12970) TaxID=764103 RepID=G7E1A2_MIXOS|nr:uncharacterized protein L969DRAFT_94933 [Mixia osmundae IAM 14324]KEI38750.1 hypothetical protein L969DRAFT_94933 [Mixia osmundae IAM 14324]GAA96612.1 hypothetical protein E5Q_03282 [Mixia osmundae IAM 14324]
MLALAYTAVAAAAAAPRGQYALKPSQMCDLNVNYIGGGSESLLLQLNYRGDNYPPFSVTLVPDEPFTCLDLTPFSSTEGSHAAECTYNTLKPDRSVYTKIDLLLRTDGKYLNYELLPSMVRTIGFKSWSLVCEKQPVEERKSR